MREHVPSAARGDRRPGRATRLAAVAAGAGLLAALAAGASGAPRAESRLVRVFSTGNDSELRKTVPIKPLTAPRVVMSLTPDQLPRLRREQSLEVSAEVQVSTTCHDPAPRCIGEPYSFDPLVSAWIVLADRSSGVKGANVLPLTDTRSVRCHQRRPNRNHHCTLVVEGAMEQIGDPEGLPCDPSNCYLNLVVTATHPLAQEGNVIAIGADRPDASLEQDKGRLNAVLSRPGAPDPSLSVRHKPRTTSLPLDAEGRRSRRAVYSIKLPALRRGEQLVVRGRQRTEIGDVPYNAFISGRLILAKTRRAVRSAGLAKEVEWLDGEIAESNGFNCTQGQSGFQSPCTTEKVGVSRIRRDAVNEGGDRVPLYLNLVSNAKPKLGEADPGDQAEILPGGFLEVLRYPARR